MRRHVLLPAFGALSIAEPAFAAEPLPPPPSLREGRSASRCKQ
jgi:hypothetical protein